MHILKKREQDREKHSSALVELTRKGIVWAAEGSNISLTYEKQNQATNQLQAKSKHQITKHQVTTGYSIPFRVPFGAPHIDQALPEGGLIFGAIHEITSEFEPLTLLSLLAANARGLFANNRTDNRKSKFIVWIGEKAWPTPFILNAIHKDLLAHSLFLAPKDEKELLWSIDLCLRSEACGIVIAAVDKLSLAKSRRFAHCAKKNNILAFFIRPSQNITKSSAAFSKWSLSPLPSSTLHPRWKLSLLKKKGAQMRAKDWIIEIQITPYKPTTLHAAFLTSQKIKEHEFEEVKYA